MNQLAGHRSALVMVLVAALVMALAASCKQRSGRTPARTSTPPPTSTTGLSCPTSGPPPSPTPLPTATATSSPTPEPSPATPPMPEGFTQLQTAMAQAVAQYQEPGTYAVAVTDLQTGETIGVNQDQELESGCIINLFVLMRAVYGAQQGQYPLETVDALVRQTIWASDAEAAHSLDTIIGNGDPVAGVAQVAAMIQGPLALPQVVLDHPPAYPAESLGVSADNLVTASAMNQALSDLYQRRLLEGEYRDYLLEAMTHVKPGLNYLTAALPPEAAVSHKNGFYWTPAGWVDNDTAVVQFQGDGGAYAYAITFISNDVPEKYADIPLGQQLV
ncbi:MAG TPA: serine hydrolase, partial [Tepidiformaceae bacterium]|nr:serine hydrolase [Tepidiformaceae bacterium]